MHHDEECTTTKGNTFSPTKRKYDPETDKDDKK